MQAEFEIRHREFAQRFLRTAVVVDDEAYMPGHAGDGVQDPIVVPGRHSRLMRPNDSRAAGDRLKHSLDARQIMDSFSSLGVICGVVGPVSSVMNTVRQADIVVLDWLLKNGEPGYTLQLLHELLTGDSDRNSLRLIGIYTGEAQLEKICTDIVAKLHDVGFDPVENETKTHIEYRHGRVVLYAKSNVNLSETLKNRSVSEEDLPRKLMKDFASMTSGLLPGIALTSLTAVREGEHRILDRFTAKLDPAFLAHRVCLSDPEGAEEQIVAHVAEELRGLMDEAVAAEFPAGKKAVETWIRRDRRANFEFGSRRLDQVQTIQLATEGLAKSTLSEKDFKNLSTGFAGSAVAGLDENLAWTMSFRMVYNAPLPRLWLGSVVTMQEDGDEKHLLCMRPRCDSVRMKETESFLFVSLIEPNKKTEQLVVKLGSDDFARLGVELDPSGWVLRQFTPSPENGSVIATERDSGGDFEFTDTCGKRYTWRGELKAEYAQRIAQTFATRFSRVAVDESEWLRRMARTR